MKIIFIVLGRLAQSLSVSKVNPFLSIDKTKLYIFSQNKINGLQNINQNIDIVGLPKKFTSNKIIIRYIRWFYEPLQLFSYVIKYKPQIIIGFYTLPKGFNTFIVSKITNTKAAIAVLGGKHEIEKKYMKFPKLWEKLNLYMLSRVDYVFTKGQKDIDFLVKKGVKKNRILIYNGSIDIIKYYSDSNTNKNIDLIFAGTFYELKGPDRFVNIVGELKHEFGNIRAVMLGDGKMKDEITELIKQKELNENIELPGYISNTNEYMQKSKIFVQPSRTEGLSTAMLEAMACGCIPIVSNVGNQTEAAIHEYNSMVVDDYLDINTYAKYIKRILLDEGFKKTLSENAVTTIKDKYTPEKQAEILQKIL